MSSAAPRRRARPKPGSAQAQITPTRDESLRELARDYWRNLRPDYRTVMRLYLLSDRKISWALLKKRNVDLALGTVAVRTSGRSYVISRLTPLELNLIWDEWTKSNGDFVFTYVVRRGRHAGKRRPMTNGSVVSAHRQACRKAGIRTTKIRDLRGKIR